MRYVHVRSSQQLTKQAVHNEYGDVKLLFSVFEKFTVSQNPVWRFLKLKTLNLILDSCNSKLKNQNLKNIEDRVSRNWGGYMVIIIILIIIIIIIIIKHL